MYEERERVRQREVSILARLRGQVRHNVCLGLPGLAICGLLNRPPAHFGKF